MSFFFNSWPKSGFTDRCLFFIKKSCVCHIWPHCVVFFSLAVTKETSWNCPKQCGGRTMKKPESGEWCPNDPNKLYQFRAGDPFLSQRTFFYLSILRSYLFSYTAVFWFIFWFEKEKKYWSDTLINRAAIYHGLKDQFKKFIRSQGRLN